MASYKRIQTPRNRETMLARCQVNSIGPLRRYLRNTFCTVIATLALLSVLRLLTTSELASAAVGSTNARAGTENVAVPSALNEDEIRDYLAKLPDERVRELLMAELARQHAAETSRQQGENVFERLQRYLQILRERLRGVFARANQLPRLPALLWGQVSAGGTIHPGRILGGFVLAFLVAGIAEWTYRRATLLTSEQERKTKGEGFRAQLGAAALRGTLEFIGIAIFALVAVGVLLVAGTALTPATPLFVLLLRAIVTFRLVSLASRLVLAPKAASLRLVPLSDVAARAIHVRIMVVTTLLIAIRVIASVLLGYGLQEGGGELVLFGTVALLIAVLVFMIWRARQPIAAVIRGKDAPVGGVRDRFASRWHVFATAYVVGLLLWALVYAYATDTRVMGSAVASLVLVVLVPLADLGLRRLAALLFGSEPLRAPEGLATSAFTGPAEVTAGSDTTARYGAAPPLQDEDGPYERIALRNLRILLAALTVTVFLRLWNIDPRELLNALVGETVGGSVLDIALVLLIAYAIWGFVKTAVERYVRSREPDVRASQEGEGGAPGLTRLETLLPLIRKFMLVTLSVIVVMVFLSELGVNTGPLIAGAGIVGIAIGFGAQTLVKDIVSGVFFLLDDAFRMGEYVEIGNTRGRVEKISIRSLQLRHHNGPVHTIPFGEISRLTNYSRDYVIMKFELRVPFETDIDKVRKLIKNVGQEMMQDPELAPLMLGPLKSQGVTHMDDSALIMRCKFTAIPGQQFMVRRAAFTRIQQAFAEHGIHFAPRRVIVEAAPPLTPEQAASAAAGALESEAEKKTDRKDKR